MKNFILLIMMVQIPSCNFSTIKQIEDFNPEYKIGDYQNGTITDGTVTISCHEPEFNDYACMSTEKVKELSTILNKYTRRRPISSKLEARAKRIIEQMEENHVSKD